jgi:hypothetical protein
MKTIFSIIAITLSLIFHSCTRSKSGENIDNVKKIRIGMKADSVLLIMGKEDIVIENDKSYITNDDSYPYISFDYDSLNRVSRIYSPTNAK